MSKYYAQIVDGMESGAPDGYIERDGKQKPYIITTVPIDGDAISIPGAKNKREARLRMRNPSDELISVLRDIAGQ